LTTLGKRSVRPCGCVARKARDPLLRHVGLHLKARLPDDGLAFRRPAFYLRTLAINIDALNPVCLAARRDDVPGHGRSMALDPQVATVQRSLIRRDASEAARINLCDILANLQGVQFAVALWRSIRPRPGIALRLR